VLCTQKPAGLLQSAALTNTTTASDCQTLSGQITRDKSKQGMHGYGWKQFEKKVLSVEWKLYEKYQQQLNSRQSSSYFVKRMDTLLSKQLDRLRWFSRHIFGGPHPGGYHPQNSN